MGNPFAVLAAYTTVLTNEQIFRQSPASRPGPFFSSFIFLVALGILLSKVTLCPNSLKKFGVLAQGVIEATMSSLVIQTITRYFWLPVEAAAMDNLPKLADLIENMLSTGNWNCGSFCKIFRNSATRCVISYFLSILFLLAVLQITTVINLRFLRHGFRLIFKFTKFIEKQLLSKFYRQNQNNGGNGDERNLLRYTSNANANFPLSESDMQLTPRPIRKPRQRKKRNELFYLAPIIDGGSSDVSLDGSVESVKRCTRSSSSMQTRDSKISPRKRVN